MISARLILDTRYLAKKGHPIKIYVSGYGKKVYLSTRRYSLPEHWKEGPTRRHPEQPHIGRWYVHRVHELAGQVEQCNRGRLRFRDALALIKAAPAPEEAPEPGLYDFWREYTKELASAGKSTDALDQTLVQLMRYASAPAFEEIDYTWVRGFSNYKYQSGTGPAGVSFYLRTMRRVFLEAVRRGMAEGNPFAGQIPTATRGEKARLAKADLQRIREYVPREGTTRPNAKRVQARMDVFLFQIYIGGHDLVDVARLRWKDLSGGRVRFFRYKNRNRSGELVDNILLPEALELLPERGRSPRVFSFIPDPEWEPEGYRRWRGHTNRTLRHLSEDLELPVRLTTKSPRYIFRTWAGEAGANLIATMQIQGHRAGGITFAYQGRLPDRIIDRELAVILS